MSFPAKRDLFSNDKRAISAKKYFSKLVIQQFQTPQCPEQVKAKCRQLINRKVKCWKNIILTSLTNGMF